jgi:FAD/FMN-containing dehydrogenase/Fe-S oxidoreductase
MGERLDRSLAVRSLYATDASAYRELPKAVAFPKDAEDVRMLLAFAGRHGLGLLPRTAGTSLAGQVVGSGIVLDYSRYRNRILELDKEAGTVWVEPGVIRDDLNRFLHPHGWQFGPETSTANRAMLGGMVGNNSCGSHSVVYGSTREHVLAIEGFLADGQWVRLEALEEDAWASAEQAPGLQGAIFRQLRSLRQDQVLLDALRSEGPKSGIPRRNTGYALDLLLGVEPMPLGSSHPAQVQRRQSAIDPTRLVCGSEGTLMLMERIQLSLEPLPPPHSALVCAHFHSLDEALEGNLVALKAKPTAVELMDHYIFECTANNRRFAPYRFFLEGSPKALLAIELVAHSEEALERSIQNLEQSFRKAGLGYAFPVVRGADMAKVWTLRKAGLGLLSNLPGDAKPAPVIEDTAVDVKDLPAYIRDFNALLREHNMHAVHYAHAGSGELHLRPIIDLKSREGQAAFRTIAESVSALVKRYRGSLSGEHGDGRLRGEFLREQVGEHAYAAMKAIKTTWDPQSILNPGKIVDAPAMDADLRYRPDQATPDYDTGFRWDKSQGVVRAAEQCNGSGDCRKPAEAGGTMCPSYHATRNETETTRARANMLREVLGGRYREFADQVDAEASALQEAGLDAEHRPGQGPGMGSSAPSKAQNPWEDPALDRVLDLCLACKGCTGECPSNVDMARLKSEWLYQRYRRKGFPWRHRAFGHVVRLNDLAAPFAPLYNRFLSAPSSLHSPIGRNIKKLIGVHPERRLPPLQRQSLKRWFAHTEKRRTDAWQKRQKQRPFRGDVWLFADAFSNRLDVDLGRDAVALLEGLGYRVRLAPGGESGRSFISKGMLNEARHCADRNVRALKGKLDPNTPLLGIEPSALLGFRDEYPDLVSEPLKDAANDIAEHCFLVEDFLAREAEAGRIGPENFRPATGEGARRQSLVLHGHCHQKALVGLSGCAAALSLPEGHEVTVLDTGCCGMAGSFGYEAEHHALSMAVGELRLFPTLRGLPAHTGIAAPGTSCRHQIEDGTGLEAKHPISWLREALLPDPVH